MKYLLYIILITCTLPVFSQVVPPPLLTNWELAGFPEISTPDLIFDITHFGTSEDESQDYYPAIEKAIASLQGRFGVIYFPEGQYVIRSRIVLPDSCVLRGAGSDKTRLIFDLPGTNTECIFIGNTQQAPFEPITSGYEKGSTQLTLKQTDNFIQGSGIEIRQRNGNWDSKPAAWAAYAVGQMAKVTEVSNQGLTLDQPLRISFDSTLSPEIRPVFPRHFTGIECLSIYRSDAGSQQTLYNIHFRYANQCWVKGVESFRSVGSHIIVDASSQIQISGNYIHDAVAFTGSGTRGYGVTLIQHAGQVIVANNIFRRLRHAMMVKQGANGNVFAYNYSTAPHRAEIPNDLTGDISLHGHYPFSNLFEGNIVQNIFVDHYWGPAGPGNMFFRNRAEKYGISLFNLDRNTPHSNGQILVGNETTNLNQYLGNFLISGTGHFLFGNHIKGEVQPAGTETLGDTSYYGMSGDICGIQPFTDTLIGLPYGLGAGSNPAKARYDSGETLTVCACPDVAPPVVTTNIPVVESAMIESVFPNPVSDRLSIVLNIAHPDSYRFQLSTITGKMIWEKPALLASGKQVVQIQMGNNTAAGIYVLTIRSKHGAWSRKIVR